MEPNNETKICSHCGKELPVEAAFCPYCAQSVNQRVKRGAPPPLRKKALRWAALLAVLAVAAVCLWLVTRPQQLEGMGGVLYTDRDRTYQMVVAKDSSNNGVASLRQQCEAGEEYRFPLCITVYDSITGENVSYSFREKIAYTEVSFDQPEDSPAPWRVTEPVYSEARPNAMQTVFLDYVLESGDTRFTWTIGMKNGDTIRIHIDLALEEIPTHHYYPEEEPMGTLEELQALVDRIGEELSEETVVYIHLPPVTYDGGLTIRGRSINLLGSKTGRTVFTGNTQVAVDGGHICYFRDLDFRGSGDGVGLSASARVHLTDCHVSGWRTGVLAYGRTWVNVMGCWFEDNQVGFHFNATGRVVSHSTYTGNQFINNGTGVLLDSVPTDISLKFPECRFSGNSTDIDNRCGQELDLSQATFE